MRMPFLQPPDKSHCSAEAPLTSGPHQDALPTAQRQPVTGSPEASGSRAGSGADPTVVALPLSDPAVVTLPLSELADDYSVDTFASDYIRYCAARISFPKY